MLDNINTDLKPKFSSLQLVEKNPAESEDAQEIETRIMRCNACGSFASLIEGQQFVMDPVLFTDKHYALHHTVCNSTECNEVDDANNLHVNEDETLDACNQEELITNPKATQIALNFAKSQS